MLKALRSLFGGASASRPSPVAREATAFTAADMHDADMIWYDDARLPLPVWEEIAEAERPEWTPAVRDAFRTAAAGRWLQALAAKLPAASPPYRIRIRRLPAAVGAGRSPGRDLHAVLPVAASPHRAQSA